MAAAFRLGRGVGSFYLVSDQQSKGILFSMLGVIAHGLLLSSCSRQAPHELRAQCSSSLGPSSLGRNMILTASQAPSATPVQKPAV